MITIAAITMIFLPGTFISAILSTTFFDYAETGLRVSGKWWVLLAVTIPLTIVVFVVWLLWLRFRRSKEDNQTLVKVSTVS
jgi:membrane protein implicated in regulation of membrane protease activity